MSAGNFTLTKYTTNFGSVVPAEVQPETLAAVFGGAVNAPTVDPIDDGYPTAYMKGSRRRNGIHARRVTVRFTAAQPAGYASSSLTVPIMQESLWAAISKGTTGTYLGQDVIVSSKSQEEIV